MWGRLKSVAMTYVARKLFWIFAAVYLLGMPAMVTQIARNSDASALAAAFQSLFIGAYFCFLIGAHLKQQFANPRSGTLPGFGAPHLVVSVGLVALVTIVTISCASLHSATTYLGAIAIAVHVNFLAHRLGSSPSGLSAAGFIVSVVGMATPVGRAFLLEIVTGKEPTLAIAMLVGHACGLLLLLDDMLKLDEDSPSYHQVVNFNAWDMRAPAQRALIRNMTQRDNWYLRLMSWAVNKRFDRATAKPAVTAPERIELFGLGDNWPSPVIVNQIMLAVIAVMFLWQIGGRSAIRTPNELILLLRIFLMGMLAFVWGSWFMWMHRWSRLGYESLRPVTRHEWVWENGVALLKSIALNHSAAAILQLMIVGLILPEFLSDSTVWLVLMWATGVQVLAYGVFALVSSYGSVLAMGMVVGLMGTQLIIPGVFISGIDGLNVGLMFALTGVEVAIGLLMSRLAFRRWCRMDLP